MAKDFKSAFCERFGCGPDEFRQTVLWRCFYPHAQGLGRLLFRIVPSQFDTDIEMIRQLESCTDFHELRTELEDYRSHNPHHGFFRGWLKIRLSGQRLLDLGRELLP
jgi:hypothetical protein